ncbi:MAG: hypothetical protein ABRQ39_04465 [Candidatus Eremiobacterota bacterium]
MDKTETINKLINTWRNEARKEIEEALGNLPSYLSKNRLPSEKFHSLLSEPLEKFISRLDTETDMARIATFPAKAKRLVREMEETIRLEKEKIMNDPVSFIRMSDIAGVKSIQSLSEWEIIVKSLDETVKKHLSNGRKVEFL